MKVNVHQYTKEHFFEITGASYIGTPRSNTAVFVSKKLAQLVGTLAKVEQCLVFAEERMDIPQQLAEKHAIVYSSNPQGAYAQFTEYFAKEEQRIKAQVPYRSLPNGVYISETARIGPNAMIEPGVVIGAEVVIGANAYIHTGAVIMNAVIGDNVVINEKAVVGSSGFTMTQNENGEKIRIYSLGKVIIGNNVEIGALDNISRGSGGDTVIEDFVKLSALVNIAHDTHLRKNVEITAGAILGGFVDAKEDSYIGLNAVVRNRVDLGASSLIGMGATVTRSVEDNTVVAGNPAKPLRKR